jgi:hypothetical protein
VPNYASFGTLSVCPRAENPVPLTRPPHDQNLVRPSPDARLREGERGSFALQHTGSMNRGAPSLSVTVVPDSGTNELTGLEGEFNIIIEGGKRLYEFTYRRARRSAARQPDTD